jgi:multisubunit Na+/H+ antiporter MnhC subunit
VVTIIPSGLMDLEVSHTLMELLASIVLPGPGMLATLSVERDGIPELLGKVTLKELQLLANNLSKDLSPILVHLILTATVISLCMDGLPVL